MNVQMTDMASKSDIKTEKNSHRGLGFRHVQFLLLFLGLAAAYAMRVNLSVAIVAMTDKAGANENFPEYDWDESTKSVLLSSFFWGYVLTQLPSGELARRFGGRVTLLWGTFFCSVFNLLTPLFANIGNWQLIIALRIAQGFCQGVVFPSAHTLISQWSCVEERGFFTACTYSGSQFGTFVMLGISGVLSTSSLGWPSIFYVSAGIGLLFSVLYFFFGSASPSVCKFISDAEREMILKSQNAIYIEEDKTSEKPTTVPWLSFFTSPAFLVTILSHCCHNWGFWTLLTEIPTYMKYILHQDIQSNALLSALPYLVMFIMCFVFAGISEILNKYQCLSLNVSRKLFNSIGLWIPMISVLGLAFVTANEANLAIVLLCLSVGFNAADYLGFQTNHIDLSPNFAGMLMAITNCAANIMSILAPLLVGFIVTDSTNVLQWRTVFYIASGIYFIGNLLFVIFGQTTVQPWNNPQPRKKNTSIENGS